MLFTGYTLSGLISAAIIFIGARFYWSPAAAARDFGIANSPAFSSAFTAWLSVKGTRDIASGLFVALLMAHGSPRLQSRHPEPRRIHLIFAVWQLDEIDVVLKSALRIFKYLEKS